jgi:hypothetical protein
MTYIRQFNPQNSRWVNDWEKTTETHMALFNILNMKKLNSSYEYCGYQAQDWISTKMKGVGITIGIRR